MVEQYLGLIHPTYNFEKNSFFLLNSHKCESPAPFFHFFLPNNSDIFNNNSFFCFVDGHITNLQELKKELSPSLKLNNLEFLVKGYKDLGMSFFSKLSGAWTCTIYDKEKEELIIVRDHLGQKPVFYTQNGNTFAFSYNLDLLIKLPFVSNKISTLSLQKYYIYSSVPAPRTLFENIFALPPASLLRFNNNENKIHISSYWNYKINTDKRIVSSMNLKEEFLSILESEMKRQLALVQNPAVAISGGIDSTTSLFFAHKICPEKLSGLSIRFDQKSFDESHYIDLVQKTFNLRHHDTFINSMLLEENFFKIKEALPLGMGDASFIPCYFLNQMAKEKSDLLITGDGADELFCGYDPFHAIGVTTILQRFLPRVFLSFARKASIKLKSNYENISFDFKLKQFLNGVDQSPQLTPALWMSSLKQDDLKEAFANSHPLELLIDETEDIYKEAQGNYTSFLQLYFLKIYFPNVVQMKAERASRIHGVLSYSPFLDLEMIEFSSRLPLSLKFRQGITKAFMKESLEGVIPREIIYRKKKGFGSPTAHWFREKTLQLDLKKTNPHINKNFLKQVIDSHQLKKDNYHQFLWNCMILEKLEDASPC